MTNATLPSSVTHLGDDGFYYCTSLTAITVDALNPDYTTVDGVLFDKSQTTLIQFPAGKPAASYTITNSVANIRAQAFIYCTNLTRVTIPNSVTNIGLGAFAACTSLTNAIIGHTVGKLGDYAFYHCTNLTGVYFGGDAPSVGLEVLGGDNNATVYYLPATTGWASTFGGRPTVLLPYTYTTDNGTITITGYTGSGGALTIPGTISFLPVTSIGDWAFSYCTNLTSVMIPNSVISIGTGAFYHCAHLTSVVIPDRVETIKDGAFNGCTSLTSMTIPDSVTSIGSSVFYYCTNLTSVTIPSTVTSILAWTFGSCPSLTGIYFQGNAPSFGSYAFYADDSLTVYYLPGTTNWGASFAGHPALPWYPQVQTGGPGFRTNQFGFTVNWASGMVVIVEACTNLSNHIWSPVSTNTLAGGSSYFSDPEWTNYPTRLYRLRSP